MKRNPATTQISQEAIDELKRIAESHGGILLPQDIVEAASAQSSALHNRFEWDNSEAAKKYRLWQARYLVSVSVEVIGENDQQMTSKVFVSLSSDRYRGGGYRSVVNVMSDETMRNQMLKDALENMENFRQKYRQLEELASVFSAMSQAEARLRQSTDK